MNQDILNHINKGQVVAIIPARSGSKGVKNKNIRCLNGYPMIAYSIAAAKRCETIERIIVSTDSEEYAKIARSYGAETPFLRPAEISTDTSTDIEFMEHVINWLYENEGGVPEYFVHVRPTYPLREKEVMEEAIAQMKGDATATSLRSGHLASNTPYKWFHRSEEGYFSCIPKGLTLDEANNPRQAFPDVYIPDGYVDVLRTEFIVKSGLLHGDKMIGYIVPGGIDIDALKDLEYLEYYQERKGSSIYEYLKANYEEYKPDEV
ncbi:MAG: acylneuraminate cytidylyltransferase family protein [Lachnospiraceae bacterium]|nr:acylneuraminate cytidylyltransferase family protein [Lachnospiraceae bacterium]